MTDARKGLLYRLGLITLLILAAYGNILNHGFVWDDFDIIVNNPLLEKLGNLPQFFLTEDKVVSATGYYRPVTYLSFALDRALWGLNPVGFNITNLVLQILVSLFFYLVVLELFKKERLALAATIIFALHPLAGETVNFHAGGRNTLLSACFALMSLLFYLRKRPYPSMVCFTLAIFSKEFALLLPAVFLFHDRWLVREKIRVRNYLPYLFPIVCYLALRSQAVQKANFLASVRFSKQLLLTPYLAVRYLVNMVFPFQLKTMYDEQASIALCLLCLAVTTLLVGAIYFVKRERELAFSDFWFLLFLLPVVNIIPIHSNTLIADRYAYFSLMGFSLALASLLCKGNKTVTTAGVVLLGALFTYVDLRQNASWDNEVALFTRMAGDAPQMSIGPRNLGLVYYGKGDFANAEKYLVQANNRPDIEPLALVGSASFFMEHNRRDQAEAMLLKALPLDPQNPETYLLLQTISEQRGDRARAQSYLDQARQAIPGLGAERVKEAAVFVQEGEKFLAAGKLFNAANILSRAAALDPSNAGAHKLLAQAHQGLGRPAAAPGGGNRPEGAGGAGR
jgi:tetratricopeptide (TPR) repeat protein